MLNPRSRFPALAIAFWYSSSMAAKETLHLQVGMDKEILDTVSIWIDYKIFPEVQPEEGKWEDFEKDSVWIDAGKHVRYAHGFLAAIGPTQGSGFDYIHYNSSQGDIPEYSASIAFTFEGDTAENYFWDAQHLLDDVDLDPPYHQGLGTGPYGTLSCWAGGQDVCSGRWIRLLAKEPGWMGGPDKPVSVLPERKADRSRGSLLPGLAGRPLRAPEGETLLRVFDSQGRIQWETRVLHPETSVDLPQHIPQGLLHYRWGDPR